MRTAANSTANTATQQKSSSNNLVILTGNLGKTAAFFGANNSAASFRMATNHSSGKKELVEWHSVIAFKELAKEVVQQCTKGRFVKVYGYLHHSKGGKNSEQYRTEVVATSIKYLDRTK